MQRAAAAAEVGSVRLSPSTVTRTGRVEAAPEISDANEPIDTPIDEQWSDVMSGRMKMSEAERTNRQRAVADRPDDGQTRRRRRGKDGQYTGESRQFANEKQRLSIATD